MPRTCTICSHPERSAIEDAIVSGKSLRCVALQFLTSDSTLRRHRDHCLKPACTAAREKRETQQAEESEQSGTVALDRMTRGEQIVDEIIAYSWSDEEKIPKIPELALKALGELRRQVELRAKLEGELDEHSITITAIPEWRELRSLLLDALRIHPQAKLAVMRALEAYDHDQSA